jgi:hypothetical protein
MNRMEVQLPPAVTLRSPLDATGTKPEQLNCSARPAPSPEPISSHRSYDPQCPAPRCQDGPCVAAPPKSPSMWPTRPYRRALPPPHRHHWHVENTLHYITPMCHLPGRPVPHPSPSHASAHSPTMCCPAVKPAPTVRNAKPQLLPASMHWPHGASVDSIERPWGACIPAHYPNPTRQVSRTG